MRAPAQGVDEFLAVVPIVGCEADLDELVQVERNLELGEHGVADAGGADADHRMQMVGAGAQRTFVFSRQWRHSDALASRRSGPGRAFMGGHHSNWRRRRTVSRAGKTRRWLAEHRGDAYVKRAAREGYRSRAAFKLAEIDARDQILAPGQVVVDLGAAPGGWSQLAAERTRPGGLVIGVDRLAMEPLPGVEFVRGDFRESECLERLEALLDARPVDLVLSDMAPNISGVRVSDQARSMALAELALDFADRHLAVGGSFLVKVFQGADYPAFLQAMKRRCRDTRVRKPEASKRASAEHYLLGRGFGSTLG